MKLLWTISNWKRTGPLEPSLDLAAAVAALGNDVRVAVGCAPRRSDDEAAVSVRARGLPQADVGARLHKHAFFVRDLRDVRRIRRYLLRTRPDWIVTTLRNDHRLALRAARQVGGVRVARLWFGAGEDAPEPRDLDALTASDAVFVFCENAAQRLTDAGVDAARIERVGAPLDINSLRDRLKPEEVATVRSRFGVPDDAFLFGIIARMQLHRRFELLWDAVAALRERSQAAPFHLLVVGRGTNRERVGHRPVAERGLDDVVSFTGYLRGGEYAAVVGALEAQLFLVPGSDPTCRALREGMALGVPSVATRRGMLPEIVADGETGLLVDETAPELAEAMGSLAGDRTAARALGAAARHRADELYDASRVAECVDAALTRRGATRS